MTYPDILEQLYSFFKERGVDIEWGEEMVSIGSKTHLSGFAKEIFFQMARCRNAEAQ